MTLTGLPAYNLNSFQMTFYLERMKDFLIVFLLSKYNLVILCLFFLERIFPASDTLGTEEHYGGAIAI